MKMKRKRKTFKAAEERRERFLEKFLLETGKEGKKKDFGEKRKRKGKQSK